MLAIVAMPAMASAAGPAGLVDGFGKTVARMIDGDRALAPFASVVFCMQQSAQCADTGGPDVVQLGESQRAQLVDINNTYNHSIRPQNDASGTDVWSVDVTAGDCEDYALTKQKHLLALGWPSRALRIAVARTPYGEGHAVLVAKTSKGDLVLDNRTDKIKDWRSTDLQWVMMQSENNPSQWVSLQKRAPDPMLVSERYEATTTAGIDARRSMRKTRNRDTINTHGFALRRDGNY
ncbi:transglutaminase-like cysteine peptidase [Rhizobium sp. B230/85]|nr:transglutaminase-like cysteine peptidase [Rhizobium sp. B209b/85]MBO9186796.1 transglutaminase-like cysteine peptidase [Rhizobium sp. E27B/91]QXZ99157.1 transglutaminase-like cysteine peptidase [Rhizobium sp. B230/85]